MLHVSRVESGEMSQSAWSTSVPNELWQVAVRVRSPPPHLALQALHGESVVRNDVHACGLHSRAAAGA